MPGESHRNVGSIRQQVRDLRQGFDRAGVPAKIRRNWRPPLDDARERQLTDELTRSYFVDSGDYLQTAEGRADMDDHLYGRLTKDRLGVIPWMASIFELNGANVLEIGCGTGTSTVALAEQGARVTGVDIDKGGLCVAELRRRLYDLNSVELHNTNAVDVDPKAIASAKVAIFFASLEHMTLDEKLAALTRTWSGLDRGAYLAVIGTPNRLWWYDDHTSRLPFYNWLPDDLAVRYSAFSPRSPFNAELKGAPLQDALLSLTRIGRAFSYHELELAIPNLAACTTHCMNTWTRRRNPIEQASWIATGQGTFERQLRRRAAHLQPAYFTPYLNLMLQKP